MAGPIVGPALSSTPATPTSAGSSASDATAITAIINNVTCQTPSSSVVLPPAVDAWDWGANTIPGTAGDVIVPPSAILSGRRRRPLKG